MSSVLWLLLYISLAATAIVVAFGWVTLGLRRVRRAAGAKAKALEAFSRNRPDLAEAFRAAAEATGKPRGLSWKRCELAAAPPLIAADKATGELVALVGVTISFEAIAGGDMEEVEAVSALRDATAVYHWREVGWQTEGRAVFNHSPEQTLQRYRQSLAPTT